MVEPRASEDVAPNLRTLGDIAIKLLTTHFFAVGNYAYMSVLQRRQTHSYLHALRIVIFVFLPTLIIVEFANSIVRSLIKFVRNQIDEDEEEKNVWFHLSAGLGLHALTPIKNSTTEKEDIRRMPLLKLDPALADRQRIAWSGTWAGKMLATLFALTQATGTIVIYARRVEHGWLLGFDYRIGAMGIASTICSFFSIFMLFLRFDWGVECALQPSSMEQLHESGTTVLWQVFLAMIVHQVIAYSAGVNTDWLYSSVGILFFLCGLHNHNSRSLFERGGWQTILLVIILATLRREIGSKIGATTGRLQTVLGHRGLKRIKALLKICFALWLAVDIVHHVVRDILDVVRKGSDWEQFMWQDPISDKLFVI